MSQWQPGCDEHALEARARLLRGAREFFHARDYLEVQTPSLSAHTASDPFLSSFQVIEGNRTRYLQTSPEFHMKRLLAAMPRRIFQICPAFRRGEHGRTHNSEFTMLEWYAPGASATDMADLTCSLIDQLLRPEETQRTTFRDLVQDTHGIDVLACDQQALVRAAKRVAGHADQHNALDLLYETALSELSDRVLVYDFPASLASLAALSSEGMAERFEIIIDGIEIANGCRELLDADELQNRSMRDNEVRRLQGLPGVDCDPRLAAALRSGLPQVSGVALGLDRLLMLKLGAGNLAKVLCFHDRIA